MKVSIVTISYNQGRFLEQCIQSVIQQTYPNIEYIVVDPGSTDGSRGIIERYQDRIDHLILEPDDGAADGLNKGFRRATGDIFGFLNADDYLSSNAIERIMSVFHKSQNYDVVSGHGYIVDENGAVVRPIYSHRFNLKAYAYGACVLVQQSTFFRKQLFFQVDGFNSANKIHWDGEFWVDLALKGARFGRINQYLASFRVYADSISGSGRYETMYRKEHERIVHDKIGIANIYEKKWKGKMCWCMSRCADPITSALRFYDTLRYGR